VLQAELAGTPLETGTWTAPRLQAEFGRLMELLLDFSRERTSRVALLSGASPYGCLALIL
jgi:hypothetical protein